MTTTRSRLIAHTSLISCAEEDRILLLIPTNRVLPELMMRKPKTNSNWGTSYKITDLYSSKCQAPTTGNYEIIWCTAHVFFRTFHICKSNRSCGCLMMETDLMLSPSSLPEQENGHSPIQFISKYHPFYPLNISCIPSLLFMTIATGLVPLLLKRPPPTSLTSCPAYFPITV